MASPQQKINTTPDDPIKPPDVGIGQVGQSMVGSIGIALLGLYLASLFGFLLYTLVHFWPTDPTNPSPVNFFGQTYMPATEVRLIIIIALAGALGSLVHAVRSFSWYVGNRKLVWSWVMQYIMLPFVGAALGLVFYLVARGGFLTAQADPKSISTFGFAAVASLVGLFSTEASEKLKSVASNLFAPAPKGKDNAPPNPQPSVTASNSATLSETSSDPNNQKG